MNIKSKLIRKFTFAISSTLLTTLILRILFPYTGLGFIITFPLTLMINSLLVIFGLVIGKYLRKKMNHYVWFVIITVTVLLTIYLYPQEHNPNVYIQIWQKIIIL